MQWFRNKYRSSIISMILISGFVLVPVSMLFEVKKVEAIPVEESGPALASIAKTAVESTASAIFDSLISSFTESLSIKELALDAIAWGLVNLMLEEMIRSTTQWVNSGFQGSPAFITDLNGWLTDLADKVAGDIIWKSGLAFLCSPFKLNVQLALDFQYADTRERFVSQCSLSGVVDNMENFFAGDFNAGGWDGWFEMSLNRHNNPYGAVTEGQLELIAGIQGAQGEGLNIYQAGRGFLGKDVCEVSGLDSDGGEVTQCTTVTPGAVIETQLNETLGIPRNRLTIADEINELVGALLGQLTKEIFSSGGSLLGLTDSRYGSGDYFTRGTNQTATQVSPITTGSNNQFDAAIQNESKYYNFTYSFAKMIRDAGVYKDTRYGNNATCHSGDLTSSLSSQLTNYATAASSSLIVIQQLQVLKADYTTLQTPGTLPVTVQTLLTKYGATSVAQAQGIIMTRFTGLQGSVHNAAISVTYELQTSPALQTEIQNFKTAIDTACRFNQNNNPFIRTPR